MKILVIRFSSMGDIVYTTPVVRCLKSQVPAAEVHFLTKPAFKYIYHNNPYLDKLLLLKPNLSETIAEINAEHYDHIVDLHNNLRTAMIKLRAGVKSSTYKKYTIRKWLSLRFNLKLVPNIHLVDRYLNAVKFLGVSNDGQPVDYYTNTGYDIRLLLPALHQKGFVAFIMGAAHFTKRLPNYKIINICKNLTLPVVLLGGNDVKANAGEVAAALGEKAYNACGIIPLDESVFIVSKAKSIIGFDTGLTHIAEAFNKPVVSIWGGTVPELLGVQPYMVKDALVAGTDISCRPCSKFGLEKCPLGHFKCMNDLPENTITSFINCDKTLK